MSIRTGVQDEELAVKLGTLYRYLLWSRRYSLTHASSREHEVAYGMVVKYHRKLYQLELLDAEVVLVERAEAAIKAAKKART